MPAPPVRLADVETPAAVVDLDRLERNITTAARYATGHGLQLRPHVKTHKSTAVARRQLEAGAVGLTCATPRELDVMATVCDDLFWAHPPVGAAKIARAMALPPHVRLTVAVDDLSQVAALASAAVAANRRVGVLVEFDVGMRRVGVPAVPALVTMAQAVAAASSLAFDGITCYPGHIRQPVGEQASALAVLQQRLLAASDALSAAGLPPRVVSAGSTPTMWRTHEVPAITEMRPGTSVYHDRTTASIGVCTWDDIAMTVLATVISTSIPGQVVLDAGTKALGREPMRGTDGEGWAVLQDRPHLVVERMSEEHGIIVLGDDPWRPSVGEVVRLVPNHVCVAMHNFDRVVGVRGDRVESMWDVEARGRAGLVP
jgi:D-serine deaminase-like pyridoxal phosphate-dependent protein